MKWRWIDTHVVLAIHDQQLAEHGGAPGVRDIGLLESALARPQYLGSYGDRSDVAALAAAYGYGLIRNHPFIDANKRTSLVVVELFLVLNGCRLLAEDGECVAATLSLAEGTISEQSLPRGSERVSAGTSSRHRNAIRSRHPPMMLYPPSA